MRPSILLSALFVLFASSLSAQEERSWKLDGELGASLFFGASDQAAVTFRAGFQQETEKLEFSSKASFDYGEAQVQGGQAYVNKRAWGSEMSLDYRSGRLTPFVFVTGEGAFERQIDLRIAGGLGSRYNFIQSERTRVDVSIAVLAERTDPRVAPGEPDDAETLARWQNRFRASHAFGSGRTQVSLVALYRPAFRDTGDYTVDVESSLSFALNSALSFKVSLVDKYDALAEARGATSNNDGRLFFSILATH